MQGDLSNNGPHNGDRLIDWSGVYNLWSHCNAAYGGFTDVRVPAPAVQDFLQAWATGNGAGRPATGGAAADVVTPAPRRSTSWRWSTPATSGATAPAVPTRRRRATSTTRTPAPATDRLTGPGTQEPQVIARWPAVAVWPGAGSNRRPSDFQSDARTN